MVAYTHDPSAQAETVELPQVAASLGYIESQDNLRLEWGPVSKQQEIIPKDTNMVKQATASSGTKWWAA